MAVPIERRREQSRAYYRRMPAEKRAARNVQMSASRRERVALRRAFFDAAIAGGCVDCGTKEQVVLDLDHIRGQKVAGVAYLVVTCAPLPKLFAEIDKCETRCANCHRRVTAQRRKAA